MKSAEWLLDNEWIEDGDSWIPPKIVSVLGDRVSESEPWLPRV